MPLWRSVSGGRLSLKVDVMAIASMRPWATGYAGDKDKDEGPAKSYIVGEFGRLIKEGYIDPEELAVVRPVKVLVRAGVVLEAW